MARSRRKNRFIGTCGCSSEKKDKQFANKKLRRSIKKAIFYGQESMPELRELSNVYNFGKDGRMYIPKDDNWEHLMRK